MSYSKYTYSNLTGKPHYWYSSHIERLHPYFNYFIIKVGINNGYLHFDGVVREHYCQNGAQTGVFETERIAQLVLNKYCPLKPIGMIKPGDRFVKAFNVDEGEWLCIELWEIKSDPNSVYYVNIKTGKLEATSKLDKCEICPL